MKHASELPSDTVCFGTNGVQRHVCLSTVRKRRDDRDKSRQLCIMKLGEESYNSKVPVWLE